MSIKRALYENYKKVYNKWTNVKTISDFEQSGKLTAKEFVEAGDELVAKIPVWQWVSGPVNVQPYLPPNKKCLVYKGAPCVRRINEYNNDMNFSDEDVDGFVITSHIDDQSRKEVTVHSECNDEITLTWEEDDCDAEQHSDNHMSTSQASEQLHSKDDKERCSQSNPTTTTTTMPPVVQSLEEGSDESDIEAMKDEFNVDVNRRLYDVYITYDKYYETPRVYLVGYASDHITPLSTEQMKEDIYLSNYGKTVTIDPHPVLGFPCISIHPCRHAETMRELMKRMKSKQASPTSTLSNAQNVTFPPQMALFLFLKFISTVVPTIEYDVTSGVDV